jgi:parvulin-like peptidyl-prolyl isomerase
LGSKQNGGRIGYFARPDVQPAFAAAAFALKNVGDVSEPVLTNFGWHVIRLDGRRAAQLRPFDEVREQILADLKQKYVAEHRDAALAAIGNDPAVKPNTEALEALYIRPPDDAELRRLMSGSTPSPSPR